MKRTYLLWTEGEAEVLQLLRPGQDQHHVAGLPWAQPLGHSGRGDCLHRRVAAGERRARCFIQSRASTVKTVSARVSIELQGCCSTGGSECSSNASERPEGGVAHARDAVQELVGDAKVGEVTRVHLFRGGFGFEFFGFDDLSVPRAHACAPTCDEDADPALCCSWLIWFWASAAAC